MQPSDNVSSASFLQMHTIKIVTVLYGLFLLQLTLVPFDFVDLHEGLWPARLLSETYRQSAWPNLAANVVLFAPFGLFLHRALIQGRFSTGMGLVVTVVAAAGFSLLIEWLQAYSPSRVSSQADLWCNSGGATVGAVLSWALRRLGPGLLGGVLGMLHHDSRTAVIKGYVLLLLVLAVSPYSFALDGQRLKEAISGASFVPFAEWGRYVEMEHAAMQAGNDHGVVLNAFMGQRLWGEWAVEVASFALLGWLLHSLLRDHYRFTGRSAVGMVFYICGLLAVVMSLLQFTVVLRGFHMTEVLMRLIGVSAGLAARCVFAGRLQTLDDEALVAVRRRVLLAAWGMVVVYIVYSGTIPWVHLRDRMEVIQALAGADVLPLRAGFASKFHVFCDDLIHKTVAYALFGGLLAGWWRGLSVMKLRRRAITVALWSVCLALPIEICQLWVPMRITGVTDLIIAGLASAGGVALQQHAVRFYQIAHAADIESTAEAAQAAGRRRATPLAPSDALIATLMDEHADAPVERASSARKSPA